MENFVSINPDEIHFLPEVFKNISFKKLVSKKHRFLKKSVFYPCPQNASFVVFAPSFIFIF